MYPALGLLDAVRARPASRRSASEVSVLYLQAFRDDMDACTVPGLGNGAQGFSKDG